MTTQMSEESLIDEEEDPFVRNDGYRVRQFRYLRAQFEVRQYVHRFKL